MSKPKFNPAQPFEAAKPRFDPSQPFDEGLSAETPVPIEPGIGDAIFRNFAGGITGNHPDELTAALGAAIDSGSAALGLRGDIDFDDAYGTYIDKIRAKDKAATDAHPIASTVANIGGSLATAAVLPGAANPLNAATKLGRLGLAGAQGAVNASGLSEADLMNGEVGEYAKDVGVGFGVGAATQGALDKVGSKLAPHIDKAKAWLGTKAGEAGDALKGLAERRAFKAAVGNQGKVYDHAQDTGRINEIGRNLLDDDVVTFGRSAREISEVAGEKMEEAWQGMKGLMSKIDEQNPEGVVNFAGAADELDAFVDEIGGSGNKALVTRIREAANDLRELGRGTLSQAQREKNSWKFTPGDPTSVPKQVANRVKGILAKAMEDGVEVGAKGVAEVAEEVPAAQFGQALRTGSGTTFREAPEAVLREATEAGDDALKPEQARELYDGLKKKYGSFATTEDAAERLANRQEKNRTFSLTDNLMAVGQMAATPGESLKGGLKAALAAGGNKMLRERGSSAAAVTLDKIGDIVKSSPQSFGKYAKTMQDAASRGNHALAVTHFLLLQQDPGYRKQVGIDEP